MRTICALILLGATAAAQIVRPVQHTNGMVVSPTNFWSANAVPARAALGLSAPWLTNTDTTNFRTAIGLGPTNNAAFNSVAVTNAGLTRSNLALGATWLTNATAPLFWVTAPAATNSAGTAGQIAHAGNHFYICVAPNIWRRVQLGSW